MTAVAGWVRRHPVLAFFLVFAVFPWVVPYKSLATQVLIYGLFALGVIGGFIVGLGSNLECKYVFRSTRFKYNA